MMGSTSSIALANHTWITSFLTDTSYIFHLLGKNTSSLLLGATLMESTLLLVIVRLFLLSNSSYYVSSHAGKHFFSIDRCNFNGKHFPYWSGTNSFQGKTFFFFAYKEVIPSQLKTKYQKDRYNNWQHVLFSYLYLQLYDSEMLGISCNVRGQTAHIPS